VPDRGPHIPLKGGIDMSTRLLTVSLAICILTALAAAPVPASNLGQSQDEEGRKDVYTGALLGIGGALAGKSATFTLTLTGRVSRTAMLRYAELLRTKGQSALLKQLEDRDLGIFALEGQVGQRVNFAYEQAAPEGRRLTVLFERWLQLFEVRYGTRSQDYPFTFLELSIDNSGKGHGTLIGAAKVYFEKDDPGTLNVENFGTYPVRVVNVELRT
jgi:hypothetical protein